MDFKSGTILSFDKPLNWTSFGLVSKVRYLLCKHIGEKKLKVGHAGTLDPLATGVLIICTGKATKQIDCLQAKTKEYIATLQLGATTPSFDLETETDATFPTYHITKEKVKEALQKFIGRIEQVPPSYSACKVDGKRAYDLAFAMSCRCYTGGEGRTRMKQMKLGALDFIALIACVAITAGIIVLNHFFEAVI